MEEQAAKKIVNSFLDRGVLLSPDLAEELLDFGFGGVVLGKDIFYLDRDVVALKQHKMEREQSESNFDKKKEGDAEKPSVRIVTSYEEMSTKKEVSDFCLYFNSRLESIQKILYAREELSGVTSISRGLKKSEKEPISIIGMVKDKQFTKNDNIVFTLEDSTGQINVLVNKNKEETFEIAKDIVLDEVIGVSGVCGSDIIFANTLVLPEIPVTNSLKKGGKEEYALFLSDLHVGSNKFLLEDFERFLSWINQKAGNEKQREIASKVKYIFLVGDLIDGVGVYPSQEDDLAIKDVYEQYRECTRLLSQIPKEIILIICAGNHDALRIAEPQPILPVDLCRELHELPNVILVSNPAVVNIGANESFAGFNVLMYHGYSFDYYVANVDSIRNGGGYDRADLIMKFLLKRRHLAPTHTSTLYVPYRNKDPLVVENIPDFFVTGHIHKSAMANYRNITLISGSCWQSKTAFQEKVGHHPEPSRVPIVNLMTRESKILKFGR